MLFGFLPLLGTELGSRPGRRRTFLLVDVLGVQESEGAVVGGVDAPFLLWRPLLRPCVVVVVPVVPPVPV